MQCNTQARGSVGYPRYFLRHSASIPGMKLWYTNNSLFTSYTTLTPHSDSQSNFFSLMLRHTFNVLTYKIVATCIEHTTMFQAYNTRVKREFKCVPCYSRLIN